MRRLAAVLLALTAVAFPACSGSSPSGVGSSGDDGGGSSDAPSSAHDGGSDGQGGGAVDGATTHDAGGGADVVVHQDAGATHDAGGGVDSNAPPPDTGVGPCTPFCGSMVCGDDGCGGSCGTCPSTYTCVVNGTCQLDPGSVCGSATCGSAASCCHCNGQPICFALPPGQLCSDLGAGCN